MAVQSKTYINICRLLTQCESMAAQAQQKHQHVDWRLSKYLRYLNKQIELLVNDTKYRPDEDTVREFRRKVEFLENIVQADQVDNPLERTLVCQHLLPGTVVSSTADSNTDEEWEKLKEKSLHLQVKGKHQSDLRKELFGAASNTARKRTGKRAEEESTEDNIDDIIKHHQAMQEKAAEEMIRMAKAMKHNSMVASDIIKNDNVELERSAKVVEHNAKKMQTESERLEELNKRKCSWTIWIMLIIVCVAFVNMIIFIKITKKRKT